MNEVTTPATPPPDLPKVRQKWQYRRSLICTRQWFIESEPAEDGFSLLIAECYREEHARAIVESHNREIDRANAEQSALALVKRLADLSRDMSGDPSWPARMALVMSAARAMCPEDNPQDGMQPTKEKGNA